MIAPGQALKQVQQEQPVYRGGAQAWWGEVIRRTTTGAGADPKGVFNGAYQKANAPELNKQPCTAVDACLEEIVPRLLNRFSSREGYKAFDDSLTTRTSNERVSLFYRH